MPSLPPAFGEPRRRKWITPVRAVLVCIVAVVAGTSWWIIHSRAVTHAALLLADSSRKGQTALGESDFPEAARQFAVAAGALDTLRRDDPQARAIRQQGREATAASQLALRTLHDILAEAVETRGKADGGNWPETFRGSYRDAWVVLESSVARNVDATAPEKYQIDCPIATHSGADVARVVAEFTAFDSLPPGDPPRRIVFAGQLDDCRPDPDSPHVWQIVLRPETGFLWSNVANYKALGFPPDAKTEAALAEQTRWLGIVK